MRRPLALALVPLLGCARQEPHGLHEAIFPTPRDVVMEWTASLAPLGPHAALAELAQPYGGAGLLASTEAEPYLLREDVAELADARAKAVGADACARTGGQVLGYQQGRPVCRLPEGAKALWRPAPDALQPPVGPPMALSPTQAGALVAWGSRACHEIGRAVVGWTRLDGDLHPLCGGGTGTIVPYVAESADPLIGACAADLDQDGEVELAVVVASGADRRVQVLDGAKTWDLDRTLQAGFDAAQALSCGPGWVRVRHQDAGRVAWTWQGDEFRTVDLPG